MTPEEIKAMEKVKAHRDLARNQRDDTFEKVSSLTEQLSASNARVAELECAVAKIAEGYIEEGHGSGNDCPCCDFDGEFVPKHHPECTYVIAKHALKSSLSESLLAIAQMRKAVSYLLNCDLSGIDMFGAIKELDKALSELEKHFPGN